MVTQVSDFGYSSPKELERNERKDDPIGGNSISNITGKKKGEISASKAMFIGTAQALQMAGQFTAEDKAQQAGIGAGLRAPSFNGTPKADPNAKKGADGDKKAEEPKGGQFKINVGEEVEETGAEADSNLKTIKPGIKAYTEIE